ncbi:sensor histidine kinase [Desertivirga xinjiangensis]|uniref:sensor histidine kinase n=1 Tax=Desertivirga xinjiangensis TaxID=539206 RepID=UPI00210ACD75|nr:ATP-binding protein [Pedobacter xinjiangensis]
MIYFFIWLLPAVLTGLIVLLFKYRNSQKNVELLSEELRMERLSREQAEQNLIRQEDLLVNIEKIAHDLKEASFKLVQSETLLKEAEALSHNGSWEWSQEKNAFYWSDELYRIHGIEPESAEVDLRFYLTLIHPDDVQYFVTTLADTQNTLSPFSIDYRIVRADGSIRYLSLNGTFKTDFSGRVNKVLGNTQDVTELKTTSLKLERSESIYRAIARNVPDSAVFLFDENLCLLLAEGTSVKSVDPGSLILDVDSFHKVVFPVDHRQSSEFIESALLGHENRFHCFINQKTFKISYTPVYVSGGEVFGVMVVMHDITDLERTQRSLEVKVTELNRSNKDLEQFAYIASHDLQEPLRKIRAFGERLKMKYANLLEGEGLDYISRMANASERMQLLIDDLLTFSRISRPGDELQPLKLEYTISQVIQDLEYSIEKKKAVVHVDVKHELKVVPSQLRQLFQNLFSNSLKFAKEEVPLLINVTSVTVSGQDHEGLQNEKNYCKIEIADNGIGFDSQYDRKIFTLFYRLHSRNEYEGTGIGLAICKKIVENHNGLIEADAEKGKGATFRIFLPVE